MRRENHYQKIAKKNKQLAQLRVTMFTKKKDYCLLFLQLYYTSLIQGILVSNFTNVCKFLVHTYRHKYQIRFEHQT